MKFQKGPCYVYGRYETEWLWKNAALTLYNNYETVLNRLKSTTRKLRNNLKLKVVYKSILANRVMHGTVLHKENQYPCPINKKCGKITSPRQSESFQFILQAKQRIFAQ